MEAVKEDIREKTGERRISFSHEELTGRLKQHTCKGTGGTISI
jgi:hypothetical protein